MKKDLEEFSKRKGMDWTVECHFYNYEYMIEFAEQQVAKAKNLNLHDVTQQRELLIAFATELQNIGFNENDSVEMVVDIYIKSNL